MGGSGDGCAIAQPLVGQRSNTGRTHRELGPTVGSDRDGQGLFGEGGRLLKIHGHFSRLTHDRPDAVAHDTRVDSGIPGLGILKHQQRVGGRWQDHRTPTPLEGERRGSPGQHPKGQRVTRHGIGTGRLTNQHRGFRRRNHAGQGLAGEARLVDGLGFRRGQNPSPDPHIIHHQVVDLDTVAVGVATRAILTDVERQARLGIHIVETCGDIPFVDQRAIQISDHLAGTQDRDGDMVPKPVAQGSTRAIIILPLSGRSTVVPLKATIGSGGHHPALILTAQPILVADEGRVEDELFELAPEAHGEVGAGAEVEVGRSPQRDVVETGAVLLE